MGLREVEQRSGAGLCRVCEKPRPPGRTTYCSDQCSGAGQAQREQQKKQRRMVGCKRCGGAKEPGIRGSKYCAECRRIIADTATSYEHERSRRRQAAEKAEKLADGKPIKRRNDAPDGQKWCSRCQEFRPLSSFPMRNLKEGKRPAAYCKPCNRFYNHERRIKLVYGLTWDEYEFLVACQDGKCAICEGKPRKNLLSVDHDHNTGEIRGLLCSRCNNKLLGAGNDDPVRLRRAADYLEEFAPREVFGQRKYIPGYSGE